ncbi:MAG TPA: hypothetical protein VMJ10_30805 [Kofleriaceae bacterium]|nr:hypothetical protein [Kofleriaceae bacterium]
MPTLRPAHTTDLAAISAFLAPRLQGAGGEARYRRYLGYSWLDDKPNLGFLIEDGGIRGFIGGIYSVRRVAGTDHKMCNLTSIWVDESHRKWTLPLFKHMFDQPGYTFSSLSPTPQVVEILRFFKFHKHDAHKVIATPAAGIARSLRRTRVYSARSLERELDATSLQIFRDHRPYGCGHFLVERGDERCYVVTVRRGHGVRAFADVIYASNPEFLVSAIAHLHVPVGITHKTMLIGLERTWVERVPFGTFVYTKLRPRLVRGASAGTSDVDGLYTELVVVSGWP